MKIISKLLFLCLLLVAGCAPNEAQGNTQPDYEATKKMVIDILKTDEGKKAVQDIMTDDKMKEILVMDQATVQKAIKDNFTSKEGEKFWKKQFEDPKFVEAYAKSLRKEHEKVLKELMKDPDYQKLLMDVLKDPELEKKLVEVMKSKEYRDHLQKVISETLESPLYKAKIQDLLLKAAEEAGAGKKKEEGGGEGGEEGGGGGG